MSEAPVAGRLAGKRAIVFGAGQTPGSTIGNGSAIATLFARAGAKVLCADRDTSRADDIAKTLTDDGLEAVATTADIRNSEDCEAVAQDALTRWGGIDIMVCNVGIGGGDGPAHKLDDAAFDRIIATNFKGAWNAAKAVLPTMREQRSGAIVNISSLAAIAGGFMLAYETSKAAMDRLTTSIAQSNASRGVRCNAIRPGLMDTPMAISGYARMTGQSEDAVREDRNARVPLAGGMGDGWDTAHAALFLASDEAKFVTGAILPVDGGGGVRIA